MRQWIRLDTSARENRKIARLAERLGIPEQHACGLVVWLWAWVACHAPDGALGDATEREIARACGWTGDAGDLVAALLGVGLLDGQRGDLAVHGWAERQEPLSEAERQRRSRAAKRSSSDCVSRDVVTPVTSPVTSPVTWTDRQTDRQTNNQSGIDNQTNLVGSRKPENQTPSEPRPDPAQRLIETAKQLEQWGFSQYGQLTGTNWAKLKSMLPADRDELSAAAATGGNSWGYLAKVLASMREKASEPTPAAKPRRKAKHPAVALALAHHAAGRCSLAPDAHDEPEIVRRAEEPGGIDWACLEAANREPDCTDGYWETLWRVYDRLKNAPVAHRKGPRIDAGETSGLGNPGTPKARHSGELEVCHDA